MTRRIHILPDVVANQIAAGEVVERPASVVKELAENALDAGARSVQVVVESGGKQRIRVSDDGLGMGREDALLSLDRHATSKIAKAGDLARVGTFGFRGEALPSIAAVSRLTLETAEAGDLVGTALRVEGGRILAVEDFPRRAGTTVEVRNLFFNAPARRKFLKTVSAETRAVSDAVVVLALAYPSVGFTLTSRASTSGDRVLLDLASVDDVTSRISDLWGREEASTLITASAESGNMTVRGLVQRPDAAGPGFRRAYLFVNGRPFRSPALLRAADRGYRTTISARQRPWVFLYLDVRDGRVDVNVHPAKLEVRFQDMGGVEALVEEAVRSALAAWESSATMDSRVAPPRMVVREGAETPGRRGPPHGALDSQMALFLSGAEGFAGSESVAGTEGLEGTGVFAGPKGLEDGLAGERGDEEAPSRESLVARPRLWQVHDTYILAETREGLLIIDQHSAHERVLFQRLMGAFSDRGQEGQHLLFPITLRLSPAELQQVMDLKGILARAGFEVEAFGGDTVILQTVPNPHRYFDAGRCFREMIQELTDGSDLVRSAKNQHERIAMTFACKGAIKAGQRLNQVEMSELFDALFATELPYHDVHGRPTIVRLSSAELERKFGRH